MMGRSSSAPAVDSLQRSVSLWHRLHLDPWLLLLLVLVSAGGLVVLYSGADASIDAVKSQAVRFGVAFLALFIFAQLDPAVYRRWSPWMYVAGMAGLVAVLVIGVGAKGAQRWLALPGLPRFQPSEIMKLVVPMMAAWYLARHYLPPRFRHVCIAVGLVVIPMGLIIQQPDLGTALLVGAAGMFVVFFAGLSWKLISGFFALLGIAAPLMWHFVMRDYQKQRVLTLLDLKVIRWVQAGTSSSPPPRLVPVDGAVRAGCREPSPTLSFCRKAIRISSLRYWRKNLALWGFSSCWRCIC